MKLISIEDQIIRGTIYALLANGFELSVNDGEETTVYRSKDIDELFAAMKTTDEDYLVVHEAGDDRSLRSRVGWVRFIYGNDDTEVINDYTVNLEPIMVKILDMIQDYEKERGG